MPDFTLKVTIAIPSISVEQAEATAARILSKLTVDDIPKENRAAALYMGSILLDFIKKMEF